MSLIHDADWWRHAVVYQIYPRSFADANGDGIGDLRGIASRVGYLSQLGVDAVWLSPFYPSALADGGYDVDDYRNVDPRIGTLEDFDAMMAALHGAGIKVVVDIVPNHSSNRHEWFRAALAAPKGSPERDRYIFRDGLGDRGQNPPSDWASIFGGPAWEPVGDGQWYLHLFAKEQPDLNWSNDDVRQDFLTTLRFWSDRGVDGFRVDAAQGLAKGLPDVLPSDAELRQISQLDGRHPLWDRNEVHDIYRAWRRVFDEYDPPRFAVGEVWAASAERRAPYASREELGQAFNFDLLRADFDAGEFRRIVAENLQEANDVGSSPTWVLSNHDVTRHATRYGLLPRPTPPEPVNGVLRPRDKQWLVDGGPESELDRAMGLRRARAATLFMLGLPGSAYIYQGEELGLHEVAGIPPEQRQDPAFFRSGGWEIGRDGCRVPLPWTAEGSSFGFGPDGAHLPQPAWFAESCVEAEQDDPGSTLRLYRRALARRRELPTDHVLEWIETGTPQVLRYRRSDGSQVITNLGAQPVDLPEGRVILASGPYGPALPGWTTVWVAG